MYASLVPKGKTVAATGWTPPVLHRGWPVDREGVLRWCEEHNCLALVENWIYPDDDSGEETTVLVSDFHNSFRRGAKRLLEEAGIPNIELTLRSPHATADRYRLLITYITNAAYSSGSLPPDRDVKTLREKLLEAGWVQEEHKQALWYLDSQKWAWKSSRY